MKGYTSKKVCDLFGCRWITVKSKRQIPLEQSIKRMKLRKGGNVKEKYLDEFYRLLKEAKKRPLTDEELKILDRIMRDHRKKKRRHKTHRFFIL